MVRAFFASRSELIFSFNESSEPDCACVCDLINNNSIHLMIKLIPHPSSTASTTMDDSAF